MTMAISTIDKVIYTAKVHTTGGRDGAARSSDGILDLKLATPGTGRPGTNPEQLFAAGWSACFMSAIAHVAAQRKISLPADRYVDAEVDLGTNDEGYLIRARLNVHLPGVPHDAAQSLVDAAHQDTCPYSKATRGNIEVEINLV
jgi:Ohr subfamily peroxiredoxin